MAGIAGLGQNSTNTSATAAGNAANSVGNTIQNLGAAQASGTVGAANAITGGIQNAGNQYYLSQLLAKKNPADTGGGGAPSVAPMPTYDTSNYGPVNANYSFNPT